MNVNNKDELFERAKQEHPEKVAEAMAIEEEAFKIASKAFKQLYSLTFDSYNENGEDDLLGHSGKELDKVLGGDEDLILYMKAVLTVQRMVDDVMVERLEKKYGGMFVNKTHKLKSELLSEMLVNCAVILVLKRIKQDIIDRYELPATPTKKTK